MLKELLTLSFTLFIDIDRLYSNTLSSYLCLPPPPEHENQIKLFVDRLERLSAEELLLFLVYLPPI